METRLINTSTNTPTIERTDVKVNSAAPPEDSIASLPALDVTPEDIESGKNLVIDPKLQPDNLTDFGAWWVKLFSWMSGAIKCRERQLAESQAELASLRETISTLQEDLKLLAEKVVIERAESNALRAENQELRQVVKEYRTTNPHSFGCPAPSGKGSDWRCSVCVKADALLAPKPVAPDQPAKEAK